MYACKCNGGRSAYEDTAGCRATLPHRRTRREAVEVLQTPLAIGGSRQLAAVSLKAPLCCAWVASSWSAGAPFPKLASEIAWRSEHEPPHSVLGAAAAPPAPSHAWSTSPSLALSSPLPQDAREGSTKAGRYPPACARFLEPGDVPERIWIPT